MMISPFARLDNSTDERFYARLTKANLLTPVPRHGLTRFYAHLLPRSGRILDLMAGQSSYLPSGGVYDEIVGLGLKNAGLDKNQNLDRKIVHDLNEQPSLPFPDDHFDACVVTSAVQYLIRPLDVFSQVARVLRRDAPFIVAFDGRMHHRKATANWRGADQAQRIRLVRRYMAISGALHPGGCTCLSDQCGFTVIIWAYCTREHGLGQQSGRFALLTRRTFLRLGLTLSCGVSLGFVGRAWASTVVERIKQIVAEQLGVQKELITKDSHFIDDLGADSLDTVELVMALEEEFEVEISDEEAEKITTVGEAIDYIEAHK